MSGFRQLRYTTDSIGDIALSLEEARYSGRPEHLAFLDMQKAFHVLPRVALLHRLSQCRVSGGALTLLRAFLAGRPLQVRPGNHLSAPSPVRQVVLQGSVLRPWLFNIAMVGLADCLPRFKFPTVCFPIYVDDILLWCIESFHRTSAVPNHMSNDRAPAYAREVSLTLSPNKTVSLVYHHHRCILSICSQVFFSGQPIKRVRCFVYLGLLIHNRVTWRPAVKTVLSRRRRFLSSLQRLQCSRWGNSQQPMLVLPRRLIV